MADTLDSTGKYVPKDLQITSQPDSVDKNKFRITVDNLKINSSYVFQFQYEFPDGQLSEWSPGYSLFSSNEVSPSVPTGTIVPSTNTGSIPVELPTFPSGAKRVDVIVTNGIFGTGKVAYTFFAAGKATIAAPAGTYFVELRSISTTGLTSTVGTTHTITISDAGETIQSPTNPTGFSINRVLGGIEVVWDGTYANGTFTGFEAIKIYVGTSATATSGTYREAGAMTGNNVRNSIVVPVDGTYLRYSQPVYVHAAAVNRSGTVGTLQQNVANNSLGAKSAVSDDLDNQIITNAKLVDSAITEAKIATSAITETKIANDAITTPKLVANAITADKIVSSAITTDKIATNAITATKILAGTIDVSKLAAGTISTNNLEAGIITSTTYLRAGTAGSGRIEVSSSTLGNVLAGLYIYDSQNNPVFKAPLSGGLEITGKVTATSGSFTGDLYASNSQFSVISGSITALSGRIGNWYIDENAFKSSAVAYPTIELDPVSPKFEIRQSASNSSESGIKVIKIDPTSGIRAGTTSNFKFAVDMDGNMTAYDAIFNNGTFNGNITSSATITGGTITGSTIQTSASSSAARIVLSNSTPDTITFYSSDSSALTGFIQMDTSNQVIGGLTIQPPTKSGWTGTPKISTWAVSSGGFMTLEAFNINITASNGYTTISSGNITISPSVSTTFNNGFTNFSSTLGARNTVGSSATAQAIFRNISAGTTAPSGGLTGDVYIQY